MGRGLLAGTVLLTLAVTAPTVAQTFTDVTATALPGLADVPGREPFPPELTGGAAVGDCDGDGLPDLYFTGAFHDVLYRNRGDGTFEDVTLQANLGQDTSALGAGFADIDNDGDLDLYVAGLVQARHFLYVNDGTCRFTEEAFDRGVFVGTTAQGRSVSFGDYDRDGYVDLYVAEFKSVLVNPDAMGPIGHLFHNRGATAPGHFDDVTVSAGVALDDIPGTQDGTFPFTARFTDLDHDGWPDLAIAADFHESRLFWNDGNGHFTDGTVAAGVGTDEHGMGSVTGDFDGDGRLDLFVTSIFLEGHANGTGNRLFRNDGNRRFSDATEAAGVRNGMWGWGTETLDFDNDTDLDLIMTNGLRSSEGNRFYVEADFGMVDITQFAVDPLRFWRNEGGGIFAEISASIGLEDHEVGQGIVAFDYDGDGDLDLLITYNRLPARLFRNDGGNANHWLEVELEGRSSQRDGLGALVTVTRLGGGAALMREVSASSTYLVQNGTGRVHFGLGQGPIAIESVRIEWPSGTVQTVQDVPIDTIRRVREPCPTCETPTPTATATPTETATPNKPACVGDCDGGGTVTVSELVTAVSIALDRVVLARCAACDRDGDGTISIEEIVLAVRNALAGCR